MTESNGSSDSRRNPKASNTSGASPRHRRVYALAGAIALVAAALLATALSMGNAGGDQKDASGADAASQSDQAKQSDGTPQSDGASQGNGDGNETAASAGSDSDEGGSSSEAQFPARFDRLGVAVGDPDAPVVVREFGDYQCPHCRRFAPVAEKLREGPVAQGKVRFVFFDFPLTGMHPNALAAAQAARCAGRQDAYWPMHDRLFARQKDWSDASDPVAAFHGYAADLGLDADALAACVREERTRKAVMQSRKLARELGVSSTPTVLVGNEVLQSPRNWQRLQAAIEAQLGQQADSDAD